MFNPVDARVDIPELEKQQLEFWRTSRVFERTMEEREGAPTYVFYEGPPTANGLPGSHHVLSRAFKDLFPRYKTMQGFYSLRKGGWDTHGLPVEIQVQKELGIEDKREVFDYGIDKFNQKCRDSVFRYITDWEKLTERIAFWVNLDDAYVTFTNDYIQSVWWILRQLWDKGLIYRGLKVVPYSPKSGTPLSSHEVSLGYKTIKDPSVYVRFPLREKPGVYLLAWTTTPWTLPSNVALAVGEDIDYVQVEGPNPDGEGTEQLILAEALMGKVLRDTENFTVIKRMKGKDLLKQRYDPLYTYLPVEGRDYAYVTSGDFVSTGDGTGVVHIAPAYGVDDMAVGDQNDLPVLQAVNQEGEFVEQMTPFRGMWFKDADKEIIRDLKARGLLYRREVYEHNYPHDWRTGTPLMYFARETWFIRATEYRDKMVALNQTINWTPDHLRDGRFGNWLDDLKDWALGRERFWGTPLPIWVDDQTGEELCVGSVEELSQLTGQDLTDLDLHRPYVDDISFPNPKGTGGTMRRVPEVIDVWFDSGAMPFAQWGYPFKNEEIFKQQYPADYICEAVDQTRGWFYSLHAISAMLNEEVAFKNVICLGHILDGEGQKMSKSKGNIVDPWMVLDTHGADAFRWYLYTSSPPGEPRRFSVDLVGEVVSKFWLTLWNVYRFFVDSANADEWSPGDNAPPVNQRDPLDQWVLSELHNLTRNVTNALEDYDVTSATRPVQVFVESLSNWYLRLNRRRFWKGENDDDKQAAYATLYECLATVSMLIAPTMPFLSEVLYRNLIAGQDETAPDSVHLAQWPTYSPELINPALMEEMAVAQKLVGLGRAARESVNIKVRQPLVEALFVTRTDDEAQVVDRMRDIFESELNVKAVKVLADMGEVAAYRLNPLPSELGPRFGKDFPRIQKMLREGEPAQVRELAEALLRRESISVTLDGEMHSLTLQEVEVMIDSAENFALAYDGGYAAALNTVISAELEQEGLAREVVRRIQTMRKDADFDISDHIVTTYRASGRLLSVMDRFSDYIRTETLTDDLQQGEANSDFYSATFDIDGESLSLGVKRTTG